MDVEKISSFITQNHHVLVSSELLSFNRSMSYISFSVKDVHEYITAKLTDGKMAFYHRRANYLVNKYHELLKKLEL